MNQVIEIVSQHINHWQAVAEDVNRNQERLVERLRREIVNHLRNETDDSVLTILALALSDENYLNELATAIIDGLDS